MYSSANYQAAKSIGGAKGRTRADAAVPTPKIANLMQSHIYLHALSGIDRVYLTYLDRAAGGPDKNIQFKITNEETPEGNFAKVSCSRPFGDFEYVSPHFTIESILNGYDMLLEYLRAHELPPPTYKIEMTKEEVEAAWDDGDISKTKYEAYTRNPEKYPVGDWQCAYCKYRDQCKVDQGMTP